MKQLTRCLPILIATMFLLKLAVHYHACSPLRRFLSLPSVSQPPPLTHYSLLATMPNLPLRTPKSPHSAFLYPHLRLRDRPKEACSHHGYGACLHLRQWHRCLLILWEATRGREWNHSHKLLWRVQIPRSLRWTDSRIQIERLHW